MILRYKIIGVTILSICFIVGASLMVPDYKPVVDESDRVYKVLQSLGSDGVDQFPNTEIFGVSAKRGKQLIEEGFSSKPGGGKTKIQSKHFVCTSCHNMEREDPDLRFSDPQARLDFTVANGLPFLQGTSLYGAVNREKFYNGDYYKKYGDLVIPARDNIREAIQLCAVECAQGRRLKDWEVESILAYLWTIDLRIADLNLDEEQLSFLDKSVSSHTLADSAIALIKSRYLNYSPAHFISSEESRAAAEGIKGNPDNGKKVYDNSCLHCHEGQRYSYFLLDDNKISFKYLKRRGNTYTDHSIYQASRYGVKSVSGRKSYMPQYPIEKLSEQQLQDLIAYVNIRAE